MLRVLPDVSGGQGYFLAELLLAVRGESVFRAQLGKVDFEGEKDGKDDSKGAACWVQHFKNGSRVMMPAPNWMQNAIGQAGLTLSWALIDEWTKVETMGKKGGASATMNNAGNTTGGINQQILGRLRRSTFNQFHPLWMNRCILSATAENTNHPSQVRVDQYKKEIAKGNPLYAIVSFSFKDASNLKSHTGKPFRDQIIDWQAISRMKTQFTRSHFLRECLGIRARETKGWYSEEEVNRCVQVGVRAGLQPEIARGTSSLSHRTSNIELPNVFYFMGVDPAPAQGRKSDDGALAILRARPKPGLENPSNNLATGCRSSYGPTGCAGRTCGTGAARFIWSTGISGWRAS